MPDKGELGSLERRLLDEFQHGFPLVERPFEKLAEAIGTSESEVIDTLADLVARGYVSRVGAVPASCPAGTSVLAALAVSQDRLEAVAMQVNGFDEVDHNHEREHTYNLWFVVTAPESSRADAVIDAIERITGLEALRLPLERAYRIDPGSRSWI